MDEKSLNRIPVSVIPILTRMATVIDVKDYNLDKVEPDLWQSKGWLHHCSLSFESSIRTKKNVQAFEAWLKERENKFSINTASGNKRKDRNRRCETVIYFDHS